VLKTSLFFIFHVMKLANRGSSAILGGCRITNIKKKTFETGRAQG
jgi:hypothetical protein